MIRFLSVCSGMECASLAFGPLGWTAAGFAEIDPFASALLAHHYGSNLPGEPLSRNAPPNFGDFTAMDLGGLGEVDVLCGGTPCQAFSLAGRRLSLADARGNLTLAFVALAHELARRHRLRNVLWENVPGVLSTDDNAFGCFLGALVGADDPVLPCAQPRAGQSNAGWRWVDASLGADSVKRPARHVAKWTDVGMVAGPLGRAAWRLFDAQYFGLAQRRERLFLVADFGDGADPATVLFEPQGLRGNPAPRRETGEGVAGTLEASAGKRCGQPNDHDPAGNLVAKPLLTGGHANNPLDENLVAHTLRGEGFDASEDGTGRGTPIVPVAFRTSPNCGAWETGQRIDALTTGTDRTQHLVAAFDLRGRVGGAQFEGPHETANLRAANGGSSRSYVALNGVDGRDKPGHDGVARFGVRRLTPIECERLQGAPENYTRIPWGGKPAEDCPDGHRYRVLGNGWAIPCVAWIGRRLDAELRRS